MQLEILVDQFTPCLLHNLTGQLQETQHILMTQQELEALSKERWSFDWTDSSLKQCDIYGLLVSGDMRIQGLVAIVDQPQNMAVYLRLAESATHNIGPNKEYDGVGGHLFAIAAQKSLERGYGGFIHFEAKNRELVEHYRDKFGAFWSARPYEYSMLIDEEAAAVLLEKYTLGGGE